jgi:hypothetical protein
MSARVLALLAALAVWYPHTRDCRPGTHLEIVTVDGAGQPVCAPDQEQPTP